MTTHDRDKVIAAAKEVGAYRYINRAAKDEPTHTFTIEQLIAFYAIAFEAGRQAEREECAKACEEHAVYGKAIPSCGKVTQRSSNIIFKVAKAIRARSTK